MSNRKGFGSLKGLGRFMKKRRGRRLHLLMAAILLFNFSFSIPILSKLERDSYQQSTVVRVRALLKADSATRYLAGDLAELESNLSLHSRFLPSFSSDVTEWRPLNWVCPNLQDFPGPSFSPFLSVLQVDLPPPVSIV